MPGIFQQHASGPPCKSFLFLRPKALQLEAKVAQSLGVRECAMRHQRTAQLRTAQPSAHRTVSRCCAAIRCVRGGGSPRRASPHPERCISLARAAAAAAAAAARGLGPVQASTAKNQHRRSHSWSFSTVSLDQPVPTQLPCVPMLITRQWNGVTGAWGLELPSGEQSGPRAQNQPPSRWHPASARPPGPTPARAGTHCASSISMQQQQDAAAAGCSSSRMQQQDAAAAQCSSSTMQQQHDAAAARCSSSTIQQQHDTAAVFKYISEICLT